MRRIILLFFLLISFLSKGQFAQAKFYLNVYEKDSLFTFYMIDGLDTIHQQEFNVSTVIELDSLHAGAYVINVYNKKIQDEPYTTRYIALYTDEITITNIQLNFSSESHKKTKHDSIRDGFEIQIGLGYFDDTWVNKNSRLKNNYSLALSGYYYNPFSRHLGFMCGGGATISQNYFSADSIPTTIPIIYERYNEIKLNLEIKFRLSTGNQKAYGHYPSKLFLDVGAGYYFPISFRHSTYYKGNIKVQNKYIHQFTDFRAFANFGYSFFAVFCEYRLTDYLLGTYPEVPLYNMGIRLLFGAH